MNLSVLSNHDLVERGGSTHFYSFENCHQTVISHHHFFPLGFCHSATISMLKWWDKGEKSSQFPHLVGNLGCLFNSLPGSKLYLVGNTELEREQNQKLLVLGRIYWSNYYIGRANIYPFISYKSIMVFDRTCQEHTNRKCSHFSK